MHRLKQKSKKHVPCRYRKYKGCFGHFTKHKRPESSKLIKFKKELSLTIEDYAESFISNLNSWIENHPERVLDFRIVEIVTLRAGLVLKAYMEEYHQLHKKKPNIKNPKSPKGKAIFQYLGITDFGIDCNQYEDLSCWQIFSFDPIKQREMDVPRKLKEEIIPACWQNHEIQENESKAVATAVSEILFNCSEHAYQGKKKDSVFQKWYLGTGEYPDTNRFTFCIYDKGQGFKESMLQNPGLWGFIANDRSKPDSHFIEKATKGVSGVKDAKYRGRGQGIKSAIKEIKKVDGYISIMSGQGVFDTNVEKSYRDRPVNLEGSLIAFHVPI